MGCCQVSRGFRKTLYPTVTDIQGRFRGGFYGTRDIFFFEALRNDSEGFLNGQLALRMQSCLCPACCSLVPNVTNPFTEFCRSKKSYSADVLAMKATPTFNGGCCKKLCRVAYRYLTDAVQAEYLLICATCGRNDNANNKSIYFATSEDSFN